MNAESGSCAETSRTPSSPRSPPAASTALVAPLLLEKGAAGIVVVGLSEAPARADLTALERFLRHAAASVDQARAAERRTAGLLAAIERLTSLYDVTKAFGSTIELSELSTLVARKAADFAVAEVASLWFFDSEKGDVSLAATAVNGNYEVATPPDFVGGSLVGDVLADRTILRKNAIADDDPLRHADPSFEPAPLSPCRSSRTTYRSASSSSSTSAGGTRSSRRPTRICSSDVARQAVGALRHVRQYEAEKRVAELDALLAVSREITSTLDLDKVMRTIVNATSALIRYDRCALAILQQGHAARRGGLRGGRGGPEGSVVLRTEALLRMGLLRGGQTSR